MKAAITMRPFVLRDGISLALEKRLSSMTAISPISMKNK